MKLKKMMLPLFAGALALSLAACSDKDDDKKNNDAADEQAFEEMEKKLEEEQIKDDTVVAVVNGEEITGKTYNTVLQSVQMDVLQSGQDPTEGDMPKNIQEQTVDVLVNQALILQEAEKEDIKVKDKEFDERYEEYLEQVGGEEDALVEALKEEGQTLDMFKDNVRESILFEKYQDQKIKVEEVSKKEIQKFYDELAAENEATEGEGKDEEEEMPSLEELEENIKTVLEQQSQQDALMKHVEKLKESAKIDVKI